jgi:hypothetical protein
MHHHRRQHRAEPGPLPPPRVHYHAKAPVLPPPLVQVRIDGWWSHAVQAPRLLVYNFPVPVPLHHPHPPSQPPQQHHRGPRPPQQQHKPRPPELGQKVVVHHRVHTPHRGHIRIDIPKRRVRFELPLENGHTEQSLEKMISRPDLRRPSTPARSALKRDPSRPDLRQHHVPVHVQRNPSHHNLRKQPSQPNLYRQPSPRNIHHHNPHPRPLSQPQPQRPPTVLAKATHPTIHILTYALQSAPHTADAQAIIADNLPPRTPHLYTIPAYTFTPPPSDLCALYSGVSLIIQEHVMRDRRAQKAVCNAVHDLLEFGKRDKQREREGRSWKEVAVSVCCEFGTHRSVSVAEKIREGVEKAVGRMGVRVRVVHVHRRRGVRDMW